MYDSFVSNINSGTSHNMRLPLELEGIKTFKYLIKPQQTGTLKWRFWYSNNMDSTFADGAFSYCNLKGTEWTIVSAEVNGKPLTFDGGNISKNVASGEQFWSDSVEITLGENDYIEFSWTIDIPSGEKVIPATPDSMALCCMSDGSGFKPALECVMPDMFAAERNVKKRIVFLGDSITQGCGTTPDKYEHWVARIGSMLGNDYSVWNIGLGYGRGSDAASCGVWLKKALWADEVNICLGVNDIISGGSSEWQIIANLNKIICYLKTNKPNINITLFTVPTFNFEGEHERIWRAVNDYIRNTPPLGADNVFDIAAVVSEAAPIDSMAKYGPHPNGFGGKAIAEEYVKQYRSRNVSYTDKYIGHLNELLCRIKNEQSEGIKNAARLIADTAVNGGKTFFFGCTHAGILAQEAFYRTGGLVIINPILSPGLTCDVRPITATSALERVSAYARVILNGTGIGSGDLLFIHSVSGRNGVSVEMAIAAREKGVKTVCITNMEYTAASSSRHESGKLLYEVCDYVIDDCGCFGDASIEIDGFAGKVSPTSTVTGAAIVNAICAETAALFVERGIEPPVFMSANVDGGDAYNARILDKYKDKITYMR